MKKTKVLVLTTSVVALIILLALSKIRSHSGFTSEPTPFFATPDYSYEANSIFASEVAGKADLNLGITMERAIPVDASQINNVTFAVFNHTDEDILFPNQGFGLIIFAYDNVGKQWIPQPLMHPPYPQKTTLSAKLESWYTEIDNSWDVFENEIVSLGYKQLRLYVSGIGQVSNKLYGAYLDVTVFEVP
ncbi:MAG: hypothetical protein DWB48_07885 [Nitrosomonas sp.]|nr:hypothetical protein [Nitrosomonas sp.]